MPEWDVATGTVSLARAAGLMEATAGAIERWEEFNRAGAVKNLKEAIGLVDSTREHLLAELERKDTDLDAVRRDRLDLSRRFEALENERDVLAAIIKAAPHGAGCKSWPPEQIRPCDCWKAAANTTQDRKGAKMIAILAIALVVVTVALEGWVLSVLWAWFMVPTFGLAALTIPQALGLSIIASCLTSHPNSRDSSGESAVETFLRSILRPLIALACGFVVRLFL